MVTVDPIRDKDKLKPLKQYLSIGLYGGQVTHTTLLRWAREGAGGVKLPTTTFGRRRYTTDDAFRAFLLAKDGQAPVEGAA